jgi:hypothetical protein
MRTDESPSRIRIWGGDAVKCETACTVDDPGGRPLVMKTILPAIGVVE